MSFLIIATLLEAGRSSTNSNEALLIEQEASNAVSLTTQAIGKVKNCLL